MHSLFAMAPQRDLLEAYRQKRDFSVTGEPAPSKSARKGAKAVLTFMVHKHDASRLHYDLRLEMAGVLASWAIPKGPSYDPSQKRLAVQTEDHPYEYGKFEGRIPDGEYGAGDSLIWDRGTYETVPPGEQLAQQNKGHLVIQLKGEKLKGIWHLIRTRPQGEKQQWLCFKAKDGKENAAFDVVADRPESVASGRRVTRGPERKKVLQAVHPEPHALLERVWPPMKATLSKPAEAPETDYFFEVKYDGYRAVAALSGGAVALESRNGLSFAGRYPALTAALKDVRIAEAVVDGEIVATDKEGVSHFQDLQNATDARFIAFDLLWLDGEDLRQRPVEERRELLESVLAQASGPIALSERVSGSTEEAMTHARTHALEGLVAKRKGSPYVSGRSDAWLKLKVLTNQEFAIVGFTEISNGAPEIGALLVAVHEKDGYRFAGKVGTGFDQKARRSLRTLLRASTVTKSPVKDPPRMRDAIWVNPALVAEVNFTEWTEDQKLRHPVFQGLREDKKPEECVKERPQKIQAGARRAPQKHAARTAREAPPDPVTVPLTHPERVIFPKSQVQKRDVVAYYEAVAPYLLPALEDRPLSFEQWPRGIGQPGFFRHDAGTAPDFIHRATVAHTDEHRVSHILVDRVEALTWLANQSALTLHMAASRFSHVDEPDWVVFDLDPASSDWPSLVTLATALHGLLEELKLASVPKTSGKRGLHVLVPLAPGHTHTQALGFAQSVTTVIAQKFPALATVGRALQGRKGRLYLDAFQNGRLKTVVAPYSLRAVEPAPASTPLHWDELTPSLDPAQFNLRTLPKRLAKVGDLFKPALHGKQRLPKLG